MLTFGVNYFLLTNQNLIISILLDSSGSYLLFTYKLQDLDFIWAFNLKISSEVFISRIF